MKDTLITIAILLTHFIADFVCQTDQMAINKSKSNKWLTIHVATYLIPFMVLPFFIFDNLIIGICWVYFNCAVHWIQDYYTSRLNAKLYNLSRHWFFVAIGFDQFIHYTVLLISYQLAKTLNL